MLPYANLLSLANYVSKPSRYKDWTSKQHHDHARKLNTKSQSESNPNKYRKLLDARDWHLHQGILKGNHEQRMAHHKAFKAKASKIVEAAGMSSTMHGVVDKRTLKVVHKGSKKSAERKKAELDKHTGEPGRYMGINSPSAKVGDIWEGGIHDKEKWGHKASTVEANAKVSPHHSVFTHLGMQHQYTKPREDGGHSHKYTSGDMKAKPEIHKHLVSQGYKHTNHDASWDTYKKPGHLINMVGHPKGFGIQHHEIHKVKATVEAAARSEHHDALESMGIKHKYSTKMANGTNEHEFSGHHDHFKQLHKHLKGQGYKHTKLGIKAKFGMFKKDNHKVIYDHKKDSVLRVVHTHS